MGEQSKAVKNINRQLNQTWKKLIMVSNTKKQGEMVTDITPLRIYQDVPAKNRSDIILTECLDN